MNLSRLTLALAILSGVAGQAAAAPADTRIVLDWNDTFLRVAPVPTHPRTMAMVHVAMFDAVNAIAPRYQAYLALPTPPVGADPRAAAIGAGYGVLIRLFPAQQVALDAQLALSLAAIPDGPGKAAGLASGDIAAAAIVALRANDNMLLPNPVYVVQSGPAFYQLTPPAFANPVNQLAAIWQPFVMASSDQFRPNGPPALGSARFLAEYEEVRTIGVACPDPANCLRTPEQTMIARWHGAEQAWPQFSRIARILAPDSGLDLLDTTRAFALLGLTLGDAAVSCFEAKYTYNFLRPVTAIRGGDADGVPGTIGDAGWTPLLSPTPLHPEYPSGHSTIGGAGGEIIKKMFGNHASFTTTSPGVPGLSRLFEDADAFVVDGQVARIYGGIHFRTAVEEGRKQGRKVAKLVLESALLPLR
jgi:hypothetical protein